MKKLFIVFFYIIQCCIINAGTIIFVPDINNSLNTCYYVDDIGYGVSYRRVLDHQEIKKNSKIYFKFSLPELLNNIKIDSCTLQFYIHVLPSMSICLNPLSDNMSKSGILNCYENMGDSLKFVTWNNDYVGFNITDIVKNWISSSLPNNGVCLSLVDSISNGTATLYFPGAILTRRPRLIFYSPDVNDTIINFTSKPIEGVPNSWLTVPNEFTTIQSAIDSSKSNDTIFILPGMYKENNLVIYNKKLTILSEYHFNKNKTIIDQTIISGYGRDRVFTVAGNSEVEINGVSISSGTRWWDYHSINGTPYLGGGIYCSQSKLKIRNSNISDNSAGHRGDGSGGGLYITYYSDVSLNNVQIKNNFSVTGSGIACFNSNLEINNSIIIHNRHLMPDGGIGGIYIKGSTINFTNVIIADNDRDLSSFGGEWYKKTDFISNSKGTIINSILGNPPGRSNNYWKTGDSLYIDSTSNVKIAYSNFPYTSADTTNYNFDPLFTSDYHLKFGSPCIDAGSQDLKDPDSTRSDIGAYYFKQLPIADFSFTIDSINRLLVKFHNISSLSDLGDSIKSLEWNFGDSTLPNAKDIDYLFKKNKPYEVILTITDANNRTSSVAKTVDLSLSYVKIKKDISICEGENDNKYSSSGVYTDTIFSELGSDTIISSHVKVNPIYNLTKEITISETETYKLPDGRELDIAGVYTSKLRTTSGCDSIIITIINKNHSEIIEASQQKQLYLYPVPVIDILNIESNIEIESIQIIDIAGNPKESQIKIKSHSIKIDMSSYSPGFYILKINYTGNSKTPIYKKILNL